MVVHYDNTKELTRGDTGMYSVSLFDESGAEYVPDETETLTFYLMKKDCDDVSEALLVKDIPTDTMQLELEPQDTENLATGTYAYRIKLIDEFGHKYTVIKSKLKLIC